MRKQYPSTEVVRDLFEYSRDAAGLLWKPKPQSAFLRDQDWRRWNNRFSNKRAGAAPSMRRRGKLRYVAINIGGKLFFEHHLVMLWHGEPCPPHLEIDHKDDNPRNNSYDNLRFVTRSTNCRKQGKIGVRFFRGKWMSRITIEGKRFFLGNFGSKAEALKAREDAEPNPILRPSSTEWEPCSKPAAQAKEGGEV